MKRLIDFINESSMLSSYFKHKDRTIQIPKEFMKNLNGVDNEGIALKRSDWTIRIDSIKSKTNHLREFIDSLKYETTYDIEIYNLEIGRKKLWFDIYNDGLEYVLNCMLTLDEDGVYRGTTKSNKNVIDNVIKFIETNDLLKDDVKIIEK